MTEKLPTCPEICTDCLSGKHNFHVEDELGCLHVHVEKETSRDGRAIPKFIIRGYAEGDGDHFWLRRILEMAFRAACKAPIEKLPNGATISFCSPVHDDGTHERILSRGFESVP